MTLTPDLKPCPMCNGEAASNTAKYSKNDESAKANGQFTYYGVNCIVCGLNNRGFLGWKTVEMAIEKWNNRVPQARAALSQQEPTAILYVVDGQLMGSNIRPDMHVPTGHYAMYPVGTAPAPTLSVEAAVAATIEAAAGYHDTQAMFAARRSDWHGNAQSMGHAVAIRAIDQAALLRNEIEKQLIQKAGKP